jgi:hypothetical protein
VPGYYEDVALGNGRPGGPAFTLDIAVDDLWLGSDGRAMVADYKATAKADYETLRFDTRLVPYDGNRSWVLEAFRAAMSLTLSGTRPDPGPECPWCHYAATWAQQ